MKSIPHITVAAVIRRDNQYLMVRERVNDLIVFNQPAGHWEVDETLVDAVIRETREETAWEFIPKAITGIYRWPHPQKQEVYIRIVFCGDVTTHHADEPLDDAILEACWMSKEEISQLDELQRRSAMVLKSIEDFERGKRYDLDLFSDIIEHWD